MYYVPNFWCCAYRSLLSSVFFHCNETHQLCHHRLVIALFTSAFLQVDVLMYVVVLYWIFVFISPVLLLLLLLLFLLLKFPSSL